MFSTLPSLNGLRAFEATARLGSFTAAATELHVTHGAVSRLVKALEEQMGARLLHRSGRGARATPAGETLYRRVRPAFELMRTGVDEVVGDADDGPLVLACYGTFLMRWLMPRFHRFRDRHPEIDVSFTTLNHMPDFEGGRFDLVISTALPDRREGLFIVPLFEEFFGPVCRQGVLPAERDAAADELSTAIFLHTETRPDAWRQWCDAAGVEPFDLSGGERYEHFYFMLQAAASGLGVAIGPHVLVFDELESGHLTAPLGFVRSGAQYYLSCRHAISGDPRIRAFKAWLSAEDDEFAGSVRLETR